MKIFQRKSNQELQVEAIQKTTEGKWNRISADVDGLPLWFETSDANLVSAPEAYGSFLLIPALQHGRKLAIEDSVCDVWAKNIQEIPKVVCPWWNYNSIGFNLKTRPTESSPLEVTGLPFSGGVDSFYTLLHGPRKVNALIWGVGYDVRLDDSARITMVDKSIRAVAAEFDVRPILISTNLRRHPTFSPIKWDRSYGGAVAALGHLLIDDIGALEISSGYPVIYNQYLGSRWDVDPFFSSSRIEFIHVGEEVWRAEKLRKIAHEDVVRRHLRVCWQNLNSNFNCGQCEKCLRTMCMLETAGQLGSYESFEYGKDLSKKIDRLRPLKGPIIRVWEMLLDEGLGSQTHGAVKRLLNRSRYTPLAILPRTIHRIRRKLSIWPK